MLIFQINKSDNGRTVAVIRDGQPYVADESQPNFKAIVDALLSDDGIDEDRVIDLFDVNAALRRRTQQLSRRISVRGNDVYFDDEVVVGVLAEQIVAFLNDGVEDWQPLVAFWENLALNPVPGSVEQLYKWLAAEKFTITEDGYIIGYKFGRRLLDGTIVSNWAAPKDKPVFVDGVAHTGNIPQPVGAVVSMPRSEVTYDPYHACSAGLHVGTWGYSGGADTTQKVKVHPADVVSVPYSAGGSKMRVCRYEILGPASTKDESVVAKPEFALDDEDEDYFCEYCGEEDCYADCSQY